MADTGTEIIPASGGAPEQPRARRTHTYSRLTTAMAALALATSIYALLRIDSTRDRLDRTNDAARTRDAESAQMRAELKSVGESAARGRARPRPPRRCSRRRAEAGGRAGALGRAAAGPCRRAGARVVARRGDVSAGAGDNAGSRSIATCRRRSSRWNPRSYAWPRSGTRRSAPVRQQIARELTALRAVRRPTQSAFWLAWSAPKKRQRSAGQRHPRDRAHTTR